MESINPAIWWLIAGAVLLALEAFGATGFGLFFAGLAAVVTGVLIEANVAREADYVVQIAWFFGFTALFAAVLWKPLKRWRGGSGKGSDYHNIIGDTASVAAGGLSPGKHGKVHWSGTTMVAELAPGAAAVAEGASVEIVEAVGNRLIVRPKA